MIYCKNTCYNDQTEITSHLYVFSDDLQDVISMQNSCHNDHTEMASLHYVFSDDSMLTSEIFLLQKN